MYSTEKISVIIPAAGIGKRMGDACGATSKQFFKIHGKPLLYYTLSAFEHSEYVDEIVLAVEESWIPFVATDIVKEYQFTKVHGIVSGGNQRQDSVYEGLKSLERTDIVLVHDAVRPFISTAKINELIEACAVYRAAILAVQPKDTVKAQDVQQFVETTLDRTELWNVQTPQAFAYEILIRAFREAYENNFYGTDESMLVEAINQKVRIVEGEYQNIKITTPDDLTMAEILATKLFRYSI